MRILYNISIHLYYLLIMVASMFNRKAAQWIRGRRGIFRQIEKEISHDRPVAWFHCASLGEFEQGRPVIEHFKKRYPHYQVFLTFFSPSGYEIRKDYRYADYVFYLPADTRGRAKRFISLVKPAFAVFIKYDYWYNLLHQVQREQIPVVMVSALFRKNQPFFRWYGAWFRDHLKKITWLFVQNEDSLTLLHHIGIDHCTVSGDTRFDRVSMIAREKRSFPEVEQFINDQPVVIAGSTWPADEEVILPVLKNPPLPFKFIIAPHETNEQRIRELISAIPLEPVRYSQLSQQSSEKSVLVIDTIGILSQLYRYAKVAYIGGGFGRSIHNIQEAVTFGVPVLFGPEYDKFREAVDLVMEGGAFSIRNKTEYHTRLFELLNNEKKYNECSAICTRYVERNTGATDLIMNKLTELLSL